MPGRTHRRVPGRATLLALLVVPLVLAGCAGTGGSEGAGADRPVDTSAEIVVAQFSPPTVFDPAKLRVPAYSDAAYISPVYDQLLRLDPQLTVQPMLASAWRTAPDGLSLTLTLRSDVRFQDGSTLDSGVVKANLDRAKYLPDSTAAGLMATVAAVETPAPDQVRLTFSEPSPAFPYTLAANYGIGSIVSGKALAEGLDLTRAPAGSGPYRLVELGQDRAVYERDEAYWDATATPALRRVTIIGIPDDNARLAALQSGQVAVAPVRPNQAAAYTPLVDSGAVTSTLFRGQIFGLLVNTGSPGLDDSRVRRALSMAVDRRAISDALFTGIAPPATQFWPEGVPGHVAEADRDPYDPDAARRLLAEAGHPDLRLRVMTSSTEPSDSILTIVQAQLAAVGVTVDIVKYPPTAAEPAWRRGETDAYLVATLVGGDPTVFLDTAVVGPLNPGGPPPALATAVREAYRIPFDDPNRTTAFEGITRMLSDEPVHVPVVRVPVQFLAAPGVVGVDRMTFSQTASMVDVRALAATGEGTR